jgi:hypothetical protein
MATRHAEKIQSGRVITTDQWADYLIYRFYPRMRVYIDGRSDFFGPGLGREYVRHSYGQYNWRATVERHGFDVALIPVEWSLGSLLKGDPAWRLLEDDGKALLFVRVKGSSGLGGAASSAEDGTKSRNGLLKSRRASDDCMGDLTGMKDGKLGHQATNAERRRASRTESSEWRLPSGLQLAEFALRGGFIAPGLLPRLNLPSVALQSWRGTEEPGARLVRSPRIRNARRAGAGGSAVGVEESAS